MNLKNHYKNVIIYDLITKMNINNIFNIPKITNVYLNIGLENINNEKKKLINIILLLKLITNHLPLITKSKKNNIYLKIKKNTIVGCKISLNKNQMYSFLDKLVLFIIPNINNIQLNIKDKKILNFQIKNFLNFFELKTEFLKFKNIPPIDVSVHTNLNQNNKLNLLLNYFLIIKK